MSAILKQAGYLKRNSSFQDAYNAFIGNENFEERADALAQWIDKPVMKYLIKKFL
jgi:hypothetical protein